MAVAAVIPEDSPALLRQRFIDRSRPDWRFQRLNPGLNVAEVIFPFPELLRTVFLDEQELHQHPMPLRGEPVGVERCAFGIVPPRRGIHVVVDQIKPGWPRDDIQLGVSVVHQCHAEDHGVGGAVGGAQWQQQRADIHVAKCLPLGQLDHADVGRKGLEGIVRVGQPGNHPTGDLPLVAGKATHGPVTGGIDRILDRAARILGVWEQAVTLHRQPPPLLRAGPLGFTPQRLRPDRPEGVKNLLIEISRQVALRQQQLPAPLRIALGSQRPAPSDGHTDCT